MINIQQIILFLFVLNISACTIAKKNQTELHYKRYESKQIQCGQEQIKVVSYCFDPDEGLIDRGSGGIVRECKSSQLFIGSSKNINLPISNQKIYENTNSKTLKEGDLSLISFSCLQNENYSYIYLNQGVTNNVNTMTGNEKKDFDTPVILNIKGNIVQDRGELLKNNKYKKSKVISANAVYGVD